MKTAIIFRANETLDSQLLPLANKVDFFRRLDPASFPTREFDAVRYMRQVVKSMDMPADTVIYADLTCAPAISRKDVRIIAQESGQLEEWVRMVAEEAREVVVVLENLADHCQVNEVDPYELHRSDRAPGGWYHTQVLAIWTDGLSKRGVPHRVLSIAQLDALRGTLPEGTVVVCDHHCVNSHSWVRDIGRYRNSYCGNPTPVVQVSEIPLL